LAYSFAFFVELFLACAPFLPTLCQEIHPIPVKEGISKGSAFCIVSSMQIARQVIAELDGQYTIPGFGGIAPVNVKVVML
jgi:hypothetical protein